jgi:hypothetical protein
MRTIALSLISHTNAGKTTLARTLIGRDVGEVRDAAHVTQQASGHRLIESPAGDALMLWDTPGFGDSARLARRLGQQGNPIGWFLSQVWDRFRDRAFFHSQQAVRNVRDTADVVLYLVNASEAPADAGYLAPELAVLEWIGKPMIVLLNQTGRPRPHEEEAAEEARWRAALGSRPMIRAVMTLDAFARCWVQEGLLFDRVAEALAPECRPAFARLATAWQGRRLVQFREAMGVLAGPIAVAACDSEELPGTGGVLRALGASLGIGRDDSGRAQTRASKALAARLEKLLREGFDRLIALHGLDGHARGEMLARLAAGTKIDAPVDERKAAMMGSVVSGVLSGLAADLAAGGLTLGAGMLTGAALGWLGGAGIARGLNLVRGKTSTLLRWDDAFLSGLVGAALLRYLAVAHYGRGRGDFIETEYPPFWPPLVVAVVEQRHAALTALWARRESGGDAAAIEPALRELIEDAARELLDRLYPGALSRREIKPYPHEAATTR